MLKNSTSAPVSWRYYIATKRIDSALCHTYNREFVSTESDSSQCFPALFFPTLHCVIHTTGSLSAQSLTPHNAFPHYFSRLCAVFCSVESNCALVSSQSDSKGLGGFDSGVKEIQKILQTDDRKCAPNEGHCD